MALPVRHCHRRQSGITLATLAVLVTAATLVFAATLPGMHPNKDTISDIDKLQVVTERERGFLTANGRRPCPADPQYAADSPYAGVEAANPGACTGGVPAAPLAQAGGSQVAGIIPYASLGLSRDYAIDSHGHMFTYVVDMQATSNNGCPALTTGGISIKTTLGGKLLGHTTYAYMSSRSGNGMWPAQGGPRINTGSTVDSDEMNNAAAPNSSNSWLTSGTLVQKAATPNFDYLVWYRPDMANTCALGAAGSPGNCSLTSLPLLCSNPPNCWLRNGGVISPTYANPSGTCTPYILSCDNGTLNCTGGTPSIYCQYPAGKCTSPPACSLSANQNGGTPGSLPNLGTKTPEYTAASDSTCTSNTVTCNSGALSCSTGNMSDCQYSGCIKTCVQGADGLTWGGTIPGSAPSNTVTAYQSSSVAYPSTCASQSRACTNGVLTGTYTNQICTVTGQPCTLPWGATLPGAPPGNTIAATSGAGCPDNTLTCTNGTPSCSTGNMSGCQYLYSACTAGSSTGSILVADSNNNRVVTFDSSGNYTGQFNGSSSGTAFNSPQGIAYASGIGGVLAVDNGNTRVAAFDSSGNYLSPPGTLSNPGFSWLRGFDNRPTNFSQRQSFGSHSVDSSRWQNFYSLFISDAYANICSCSPACSTSPLGCSCSGPPACTYTCTSCASGCTCTVGTCTCNAPSCPAGSGIWGAAADNVNGYIYVTDQGNQVVDKFNLSNGSYISTFASGTFSSGSATPTGIAVDNSGGATNSNVYVANKCGGDVYGFSSSGSALPGWPTAAGALSNPSGVAVDGSGNVYVADTGNNRVVEYNSSGTVLTTFGTVVGSSPIGIAVDSSNNVWVTDSGNNVEECSGGSCTVEITTFNSGQTFSSPQGIAIIPAGAACSPLPWNPSGSLASGGSLGAYSNSSVNPPATCGGQNTLSCNNGVFSCSTGNMSGCQSQGCVQNCSLPWGGFLASGSSVTAYNAASVPYPGSCSGAQLTCTNGTLSGPGGYTFQTCAVPGAPCTTPWGAQLSANSNTPAYPASFENAPATCTSSTLACDNNGNLTCNGSAILTNCQVAACTEGCQLTANQGGQLLNINLPGNTAFPEYPSNSAVSCGSGNTVTCSAAGLSCSDGVIGDCQYDSCTPSSGNLYVVDYGNSRVEEITTAGAYLGQFGTSGSGNGDLLLPQYMAVDSSGNFWIADYGNNRVEEFSSGGAYVNQFGTTGYGNGQFVGPMGIAIDKNGNFWVVDTGNRVQEFSGTTPFTWMQTIPNSGCSANPTAPNPACPYGSANGQFYEATGVTADSSGNIWVTDFGNARVQEFNGTTGAYINQFGSSGTGNGQFIGPQGITTDSGGNVWVTDIDGRIDEFTKSCVWTQTFNPGNLGIPQGIAIDSGGNVWVVDWDDHVTEFNSSGTTIKQFGSGGFGNGQFDSPIGLIIH